MLVGQAYQAPFGKAAADWSEDDLGHLKADLDACQITAARAGNPFFLDEIKSGSRELIATIPGIVNRAREEAQARARQIEARRRIAAARIDSAAKARDQAKASGEAEATKLENEAATIEAEARAAQRRADEKIARANRARDEARSRADAIASLERSAEETANTLPHVKWPSPGELGEIASDEPDGAPSGPLPGPASAATIADAMACRTIANAKDASQLQASRTTDGTSESEPCIRVAKGTKANIQAAGAAPGFSALCVGLEGHPDCLWMPKIAFEGSDR